MTTNPHPTAPPNPGGAMTERTVVCPACGGPSVYAPRNAHRPFCSQRCKLGDLGHWASESFRMPAGPGTTADNEE